jgi:ankyrin repeat protein
MTHKKSFYKKGKLKKHYSKKTIPKIGCGKSECDEDLKELFFSTIQIGDFELVSKILSKCPSFVNVQNDFDIEPSFKIPTMMTPLYYAVSRFMKHLPFNEQYFPPTNNKKDSFYQIAELLINKGADVNVTTPKWFKGWAPIHWAAEYGNVDMVNLLKKHGANVNLTYELPNKKFMNLRDIGEMRIIQRVSKNYEPFLDNITSRSSTDKLPKDLPEYFMEDHK